jgi:hypothetical protein
VSRALLGALAAVAALVAVPRGPDPATQAVRDGCPRDYSAEIQRQAPTWVYVGDAATSPAGPPPPPRWAHGVVDSFTPKFVSVAPTPEDVPTIHDSYDFNFDLRLDTADRGLLGGDPVRKTGNFAGPEPETGRLHVEREQLTLPQFAWPEIGDRVTLDGSWIWDCGHWLPGGERTEFHSYRAIFVRREPSPRSPRGENEGDLFVTSRKTFAGIEEDCAHRTRGDSAAYPACLRSEPDWQDVTATYRFSLPAPPRPSAHSGLRWRVVDRGTTRGAVRLAVTPSARGVRIEAVVSNPRLVQARVAKAILVGWSRPPRVRPVHLRIRFERLLVRRAMDPGCPPDRPTCSTPETTHKTQNSTAPGEWNVYWDAAGIWSMWSPRLLHVFDGQVVRGRQSVDLYLPPRRPWRLLVFARECDFLALGNASDPRGRVAPCPAGNEVGTLQGDDESGFVVQRFRLPAAVIGVHRADSLPVETSCPRVNRHGCYAVTYRVDRVRG